MRWITAAALALLAAPAYGQENDAEKLFRAMEKKVRSAKTMHFIFDGQVTMLGEAMKGTLKGEVRLAEGEKANMVLQGDFNGKSMKMTMISDGKKAYSKFDDMVDVKDNDPAEKKIEQAFGMVARLGMMAAWYMARGADKETDIEKIAPIKDFKLGPKDKIGKQDTQVVQYQVTMPQGPTAKATVWIDSTTRLPAKREVVFLKDGAEQGRLSETYSTFTIDGKIDAKVFELPK